MKRCPKCGLGYTDNTLEFCLEDGTRLAFSDTGEVETPTVTFANRDNRFTQPNEQLPFPDPAGTLKANEAVDGQPEAVPSAIKEKVLQQGNNALEIAPIIIALAHNWWQWVYLDNQPYSSFSTYIFSASFLMWLVLIMAGAAVSLLAVKRCKYRGFAFTGLIVLSINLILMLVPRR